MANARPKLAVWKFASCDGCQLSLLDCEDELLLLPSVIEIAHFPEATRRSIAGPYDISLVEGSITRQEDLEILQEVRKQSRFLISIGACATAGGIQALRNQRDVKEFISLVYARPEYISTLQHSTPISNHVRVDYELHGCPVNKRQLLELILTLASAHPFPDGHQYKGAPARQKTPEGAELPRPHPKGARQRSGFSGRTLARGALPSFPSYSVCVECKSRGTPCLLVTSDAPCLGPVTHAGCDALCPRYQRGCFGCYGPAAQHNVVALTDLLERRGTKREEIQRLLSTFNVAAQPFQRAAQSLQEVASTADESAEGASDG